MNDVLIPTPRGQMLAYLALPCTSNPSPGVVVLHDVFGMSQDHRNQAKWLAEAGFLAASPDLLIVYSLATIVQLFVLGGQPKTAAEAFSLLEQHKGVELLRLDLPTVFVLPLYYLRFLGMYAALRRVNRANRLFSTVLVFAGLTMLLATPGALSMLALSDRYAATMSDGVRAQASCGRGSGDGQRHVAWNRSHPGRHGDSARRGA